MEKNDSLPELFAIKWKLNEDEEEKRKKEKKTKRISVTKWDEY